MQNCGGTFLASRLFFVFFCVFVFALLAAGFLPLYLGCG
jgi:hypothetical protein